ncbi:MAG: hypothetical protein WCO44_08570 [Bacteroidota bacterium]
MTIAELNEKYHHGELSIGAGDQEFRYLLFSPLFKNLYQDKVVYHERFTSIIKLENIILAPDRFEAVAIRHLLIDQGSAGKRPLPEKWTAGANWAYLRLSGSCLTSYSGWLMWVDPVLVEKVERLTLEGNVEAALKLTILG